MQVKWQGPERRANITAYVHFFIKPCSRVFNGSQGLIVTSPTTSPLISSLASCCLVLINMNSVLLSFTYSSSVIIQILMTLTQRSIASTWSFWEDMESALKDETWVICVLVSPREVATICLFGKFCLLRVSASKRSAKRMQLFLIFGLCFGFWLILDLLISGWSSLPHFRFSVFPGFHVPGLRVNLHLTLQSLNRMFVRRYSS